MSDLEKRLRNNEYFPKTARKEDWLEAADALAAKDARIAELEKALAEAEQERKRWKKQYSGVALGYALGGRLGGQHDQ